MQVSVVTGGGRTAKGLSGTAAGVGVEMDTLDQQRVL